MPQTTRHERFPVRRASWGAIALRAVLLAFALVAGSYLSEGILEAWQADGSGQAAKKKKQLAWRYSSSGKSLSNSTPFSVTR